MLTEVIRDILSNEGVASFTTQGIDEPHMAATWNSYIRIDGSNELLIPAGSLFRTEENSKNGSDLQMIIASKRVQGMHGDGAGFLLQGTAVFEDHGHRFEQMKSNFPWARAVMVFKVSGVKQLI